MLRKPVTHWCDCSIRVRIRHQGKVREEIVRQPYAILGAHPNAHVRLPRAEGIGTRCLYLHVTPLRLCYFFLNRNRNPSHGDLPSGEWLQVGEYEISAETINNGCQLEYQATLPEKMPRITIQCDGKEMGLRLRSNLTVIGRRRPATLRIHHQSVSTCHCVLYWDGGKLWAVDLLSRRGTLQGKQAIECDVVRGELALASARIQLVENPSNVGFIDESDSIDSLADVEDSSPSLSAIKFEKQLSDFEEQQRLWELARAEQQASLQSERLGLESLRDELESSRGELDQRWSEYQAACERQSTAQKALDFERTEIDTMIADAERRAASLDELAQRLAQQSAGLDTTRAEVATHQVELEQLHRDLEDRAADLDRRETELARRADELVSQSESTDFEPAEITPAAGSYSFPLDRVATESTLNCQNECDAQVGATQVDVLDAAATTEFAEGVRSPAESAEQLSDMLLDLMSHPNTEESHEQPNDEQPNDELRADKEPFTPVKRTASNAANAGPDWTDMNELVSMLNAYRDKKRRIPRYVTFAGVVTLLLGGVGLIVFSGYWIGLLPLH
ncbi:MAG: FHA domain-containing protein [Planctomycetales bacterium]|nr:FHA domain-containing protein [Planctomycetales bacterium]